jgi:hypothetical protein
MRPKNGAVGMADKEWERLIKRGNTITEPDWQSLGLLHEGSMAYRSMAYRSTCNMPTFLACPDHRQAANGKAPTCSPSADAKHLPAQRVLAPMVQRQKKVLIIIRFRRFYLRLDQDIRPHGTWSPIFVQCTLVSMLEGGS